DAQAHHAERSRLELAVFRQAHERHGRATPRPREEGELLAVEEGQHPRARVAAIEGGMLDDGETKAPEPEPRDEAHHDAQEPSEKERHYFLSSSSSALALSSEASFSIARSSICTARALSPRRCEISPR